MALPSPDRAPYSQRELVFAGIGVWAVVVISVASQNYATYAVKRETFPAWTFPSAR